MVRAQPAWHQIFASISARRARTMARTTGFRPVGVLRAYQLMPDGVWIDGLLMDLLAHEFVADAGDDAPGSSAAL